MLSGAWSLGRGKKTIKLHNLTKFVKYPPDKNPCSVFKSKVLTLMYTNGFPPAVGIVLIYPPMAQLRLDTKLVINTTRILSSAWYEQVCYAISLSHTTTNFKPLTASDVEKGVEDGKELPRKFLRLAESFQENHTHYVAFWENLSNYFKIYGY